MILMPQIFDVTANENARYKRNELECTILYHNKIFTSVEYFLYKLYWKRRVCHDSMKSIAMQISTAPPIMTYIVLLSAYEVVDING